MRKFTLFIASLFLAVGAMAQTATTYADGVYKIHWSWNGRGYLAYHNDYPNSPQLAGVVNHNPSGHYQLTDEGVNLGWYLYTSLASGKSYLFEATTGKFITIDENRTVGNGKACVLSEEVTAKSMLTLKATTNTNAYMLTFGTNYNFCSGCGNDKGNDPVRFATDGQSDGGIPFVFVADGVTISDEIKNAAIAKIEAYEATLYPYNGKIYALDSYRDYIYALTDGSTAVYTNGNFSGTVDTRALWKFEYRNGAYNIKNVHTGLYIGATNHNSSVQMSETPGNYEIVTTTASETAESGKYYIKVNGVNACLHSTGTTAKGWEGGGLGNQYVFTEVTNFTHTLRVGESGYATLMLGFNAEIPDFDGDDYGVFIVTPSAVAGNVHLTKVEGVLPANTAVIVKANPNSDVEFAYSTGDPADVSGNLLLGTLYNKNIAAEAYVLNNGTNGIGFYGAILNKDGNTAFLNNANKAYLPATAGANLTASFYGFDWDGTTGIEEVKGESGEVKTIYDLTGRRVEAITAPGIYIVGGKKVLVK
jgi:hypothetical protein